MNGTNNHNGLTMYYTIKELNKHTILSRKQINNRVLKTQSRYPDLVIGGGKGKGGRYLINPFLYNYIVCNKVSEENSKKNFYETRLNTLNVDIKTFTNYTFDFFNTFCWSWFCCLSPLKKVYDPIKLIDMVPLNDMDVSLYSIHRNTDESLHIHFVLNNDKKGTPLFLNNTDCNSDFRQYDWNKSVGCFNYLTNTKMIRRNNQTLVDFGFLIGFKFRNKIKNLRVDNFTLNLKLG